MYSVVAWRAPSKAPLAQRCPLGPIWVQGLWLERTERTPKWLVRHRVNRGRKWLESRGITQGVCPPEMEGLAPVSTVALRQGLAVAQLAQVLAQQAIPPPLATVGLVAERMTPRLFQTVEQLALRHRHVLLQVAGGEEACQRLRGLYGVAVQCNLGLNALRRCDAVVGFAPMAGLEPAVVTYDETAWLPPLCWPTQWQCPPQVSPLQGWAMVANTETWKEDWVKLALMTEILEI